MKYLILLFLMGCNFPTMPRQSDATDLVWRLEYNQDANSPPQIHWITQKHLNCAMNDHGMYEGFYRGNFFGDSNHTNDCVLGVTWVELNISEIAWPDGWSFDKSVMPHEFFHQYLYNTTGDPDSDHKNPGFGIHFGFPFGIVDQANEDLAVFNL